jgi:hypothetical protein
MHQGDREKREGLQVSPNMDRHATVQAELSVNFIDFIVAPFFVALTDLLPDVHLRVRCAGTVWLTSMVCAGEVVLSTAGRK